MQEISRTNTSSLSDMAYLICCFLPRPISSFNLKQKWYFCGQNVVFEMQQGSKCLLYGCRKIYLFLAPAARRGHVYAARLSFWFDLESPQCFLWPGCYATSIFWCYRLHMIRHWLVKCAIFQWWSLSIVARDAISLIQGDVAHCLSTVQERSKLFAGLIGAKIVSKDSGGGRPHGSVGLHLDFEML